MSSFDVISAIELTASAAIVIAALALSIPAPARSQLKIACGLVAWFTALATLCALGAFAPGTGIGTPGLGAAIAVPLVVILWLVLADRHWREHVLAMPLPILIGVHAVRILGLDFVLLHAAGRLPAPFAPTAGWGDVIAGVAALPVAWAVAQRVAGWRSIAMIFTLYGTADLVTAIALGVTSAPDSPVRIFSGLPDTRIMSTLPWILIPAFLVPLLLLAHIATLWQLARAGKATGHTVATGGAGAAG
jgi:hypothetical protein